MKPNGRLFAAWGSIQQCRAQAEDATLRAESGASAFEI